MARIIGIDLGTTNSCVATIERGLPRVLASPTGERTFPSVVTLLPGGEVAIGVPARRQAVSNATRTILAAKRLIGRKVNAPDVERFARMAPFQLTAAPNGDAWLRLPERDVSPQEVSSYVLEALRRTAEQALGEPVTQAVVTVPAYFNDAQRQATRDAGRLAGLDVRRILNEPTAAALAYGVHRRASRQRVAIFDLGGGTFDVSILRVEEGVFEVLAVSGDMALGGDDFDRLLVEQALAEMNIAELDDPVALGRLLEEAERVKRALSEETSARLQLPYLTKDVHIDRTVERRAFEEMTRDLLERLEPPCRQALAEAGLGPGQLDDVLLVGGMTRMPAVQAAVERIFGRKPSKRAHPEEIVAQGAAAHAGILSGELDDAVLIDVLPHSVGIRSGASVVTVIAKNASVPARAKKLFATTRDDQSFVAVEVVQGEAGRHLGRFTLDGLPRGRAGSVRVELSFLVDADGIVSVTARELSTGRNATLTITPAAGLGEEGLNAVLETRRRASLRF